MRKLIFAIFILATGLAKADESLAKTMQNYENFYFSSVPGVALMKDFKKKGGEVVIDLRDFDEKDKECGALITTNKLGLRYQAAPMPKANPFTPETIRFVEETVKSANGKPVLLFCSSGQRAAAWLAIHLANTQKLSPDKAITVAETVGLKSEHIEEAVKDYLQAPHQP